MRQDTITLAIFGGFLAVFSLGALLLPKRTFSQMENRPLSSPPQLTLSSVMDGSFAKESERYLSDQAVAKDALVILKNDLSFAMGQRQLGEVYVSTEGAYLSRYQENRAQIDRNLAQINRFAASVPKPLPISLLLVPNAVGVYPENTPALSDCGSQADTLAYVKQRLSGRVQLLSPYEKLAAHKEEALYYQTDHHWTMRGAYYGYAALMEGLGRKPLPLSAFGPSLLADDFQGSLYSKAPVSFAAYDEMPYYQAPGLRVQLTYDDGTKTDTFLHTDALLQKDKYTVFTGGNQPSLQVSSNAAGTERVLVLKDSYANCLLPYLATAFPEMSVLDLRYFRGNLAAYIQEHSITRILLCYNIDFLNTDDHFIYLNQ